VTTSATSAIEGRATVAHHDFEEFVRATSTRLTRTAVLLTGDREAARDLVQTAYATAYRRWRLVSRADNPVAYTRAILTKAFLSDRRRKRVGEVPLETADRPTAAGDPHLRLSLLDALATLPPVDRTILVARYWEDLPVAETARLLDLSEGAVRTRASRALARLRTHFPELEES
jgi:RNA polymerase sigma-70 factor (sigma-E family)